MPPSGNWDRPSRSDMALVRLAIRRGWPVPPAVRKQIVRGLCRTVEGQSPRHVVTAARLLVALDESSHPAGLVHALPLRRGGRRRRPW
jgi:hypothetical protein